MSQEPMGYFRMGRALLEFELYTGTRQTDLGLNSYSGFLQMTDLTWKYQTYRHTLWGVT